VATRHSTPDSDDRSFRQTIIGHSGLNMLVMMPARSHGQDWFTEADQNPPSWNGCILSRRHDLASGNHVGQITPLRRPILFPSIGPWCCSSIDGNVSKGSCFSPSTTELMTSGTALRPFRSLHDAMVFDQSTGGSSPRRNLEFIRAVASPNHAELR